MPQVVSESKEVFGSMKEAQRAIKDHKYLCKGIPDCATRDIYIVSDEDEVFEEGGKRAKWFMRVLKFNTTIGHICPGNSGVPLCCLAG